MAHAFDQEIVLEFLTESGDLLRQFEDDLALLLAAPSETELLNRAFRAIHTLKGNASFFSLDGFVTLAHATETALNTMRDRRATIDQATSDLLLAAVDSLRTQLRQFERETDIDQPEPALLAALNAVSQCEQPSAPTTALAMSTQPSQPAPEVTRPLVLSEGKAELLGFLIADLDETLASLHTCLATLTSQRLFTTPAATLATQELARHGVALERIGEFFDFALLGRLARLLSRAGTHAPSLPASVHGQISQRLTLIAAAVAHLCDGLKHNELRAIAMGQLPDRLEACLSGSALDAPTRLPPNIDAATAAIIDGVDLPATLLRSIAPPHNSLEAKGKETAEFSPPIHTLDRATSTTGPAPSEAGKPHAEVSVPLPNQHLDEHPPTLAPSILTPSPLLTAAAGAHTSTEPTVRVEVQRLDGMMDLVTELLIQKHRIASLAGRMLSQPLASKSHASELHTASVSLDRAASELRSQLLGAGVQPIGKLFARIPRLVNDLALRTGKQIRLITEGGEIEADKHIIEALADPLLHLIRNACDHGLESPAERTSSGKDATGTITLRATKQAGTLCLIIMDDGRGLSRDRIGAKAVERGLTQPDALSTMTESDVFRFIFEPGFSTADHVSDISGRGVGLDVVRANVEKLRGTIELASHLGAGTSITIMAPTSERSLPALLFAVATESFAVPLEHVVEIVRPSPQQYGHIGGSKVLRHRDGLLPLISASQTLGEGDHLAIEPYVLVLRALGRRVGLCVTKIIDQQHVISKPIEGARILGRAGAFSSGTDGVIASATQREDGGVSLLIDVEWIIKAAEAHQGRAAA